MRRIPVLLACFAGLLFAQPALADATQRPAEPNSLSSTHFTVLFNSDPTTPGDYVTRTQAGDLASLAERALAAETGWGYQPPIDDSVVPNGRIEIYVVDATSTPGLLGAAFPDRATAPTSGSIDIAQSVIDTPLELHAIAHELFHLIQFRTWVPTSFADHWLLEGSAEWAGFRVDNFAHVDTLGPPDVSLDCLAANPSQYVCDPTDYIDTGYSRWPFFEYVAQRYGTTFLNSVLAQGAGGVNAVTALSNAIVAKGGTLSDVFGDWALRQLTGGYGISALDSAVPATVATVSTGTATADLPATKVSVNHLAVRFVELDHGGGGTGPCFAAQLTVTVDMPAGVGARPALYVRKPGSTPQSLNVSGNTASLTVPWDTCTSSDKTYVSLPNPTTNIDAATFSVTEHLAVDTTTPANTVAPPAPVTMPGTVVPVPTTEVSPAIDVFGPLLIRLSAKDRAIRLIVSSSGDGVLHASLGSADLGVGGLRAGNNDLRFVLPKGLVATLRSSAAAANVLTLTPESPSGAASGTPVTRVVRIAKATAHK